MDLGGYRPCLGTTHGMGTPGGRGAGATPKIIRVTSLADTNTLTGPAGDGTYAGTFRGACLATGPRFVGFEVSGYITLASNLTITEPYLTVAGQTAPAPGVCIRSTPGFGSERSIRVATHDTVWQHLRIRPGESCNSGILVWNLDTPINVNTHLFDHVSVSWAQDEGFAFTYDASDITLWRCLIGENLNLHPSAGGCTGGGNDNSHGVAVGWGSGIAVLQSLLAHNYYRNPQSDGASRVYLANNVLYGSRIGMSFWDISSRGPQFANVIGNYFRRDSNTDIAYTAISATLSVAGTQLFLSDNVFDNGSVAPAWTQFLAPGWGDPRVGSSVVSAPAGYTPLSGAATLAHVLQFAGARPKYRRGVDQDGVDTRILDAVRDRTGSFLVDPDSVGGYPALATNTRVLTIPSNPLGIADAVGRTRVERYFESLAFDVEMALDWWPSYADLP